MGLTISSQKTEELSKTKFHILKKTVSITCKEFKGKVFSNFHVWRKSETPLIEKRTLKPDSHLILRSKQEKEKQTKLEILRV